MSERIGLTLGKFAPLHKGHEYLIRAALSEMDSLIVIVYNASEVTAIPTEIRANWIRKLFPKVQVFVADDGPQMVGYTEEIKRIHETYLKRLLKDYRINSFYSSEPYGEHISIALNCINRTIDLPRCNHPVAATIIRENTPKYRHMVSEIVYWDIKPRIAFIGGPSTGKTTLAKLCAEHIKGDYCPEYGREYWFHHQKDHRLSMLDLELIATRHLESEDAAAKGAGDRLFVDTTVLTTLAYANYYFGKASRALTEMFSGSQYRYSIYLLCAQDIPFDDTWDRSGPGSRKKLQQINLEILEKHKLNYSTISGNPTERVAAVNNILEECKL